MYDQPTNTYYHFDSARGSHKYVAYRLATFINRAMFTPEDGANVDLFLHTKARYHAASGTYQLVINNPKHDQQAIVLRPHEDFSETGDAIWAKTAVSGHKILAVCPELKFEEVESPRQADGTSCGMYVIEMARVLADMLSGGKTLKKAYVTKLRSEISKSAIMKSRKLLAKAIEQYAQDEVPTASVWPFGDLAKFERAEEPDRKSQWTPGKLCVAWDRQMKCYYPGYIISEINKSGKVEIKYFRYSNYYMIQENWVRSNDTNDNVCRYDKRGYALAQDQELRTARKLRNEYDAKIARLEATTDHSYKSRDFQTSIQNASLTPQN
eukprot:TRINITY_DN3159_c0_g1_i2.p1 TRINITY_DN3159_c0_g1~~TRINITY_DN3159_c0_g1_i2.p1  ORF type:complete len:324 (-),score=58.36 TRINITY_DN3159_c0_g1_i2:141-1112(-)